MGGRSASVANVASSWIRHGGLSGAVGIFWTLALASSTDDGSGKSSLAATAGWGEDPVISMGGAAQFRSELVTPLPHAYGLSTLRSSPPSTKCSEVLTFPTGPKQTPLGRGAMIGLTVRWFSELGWQVRYRRDKKSIQQ